MPFRVEPKSQVDRSEFTLSYRALARARVIGPLGGLGGVGMDVDVGGFTSSLPPPLEKEASSTLGCLHLHGMVIGHSH